MSSIEIEKVYAVDLEVGMYVSALDRPWLDTPFLLQGFRIETAEELRKLREVCQYVFIDYQKSQKGRKVVPRRTVSRPRRAPQELFGGRRLKRYEDKSAWREEFPLARAAVQELSAGIESVFENVARGGALDVLRVRKSVEPMIDSISRNPDACIWLARIKQQDQYTYQHSLGASIWAVALGRQLGLPRSGGPGRLLLREGRRDVLDQRSQRLLRHPCVIVGEAHCDRVFIFRGAVTR